MSLKQKLNRELKSMLLAFFYFACWIGAMLVLKFLLLAEYKIASYGWGAAIVGALVLAKVVLVLEHVPLRRVMGERPAWVDVVARTVLYAFGVVVVLALERGVKGWSEHGGFFPALEASLERTDPGRVWVNTFCICSGLLGYNALTVVRRNVGDAALVRMFRSPLPEEGKADAMASGAPPGPA